MWSPAPVLTSSPSLYQVTEGSGSPDTAQLRVTGPFLATVVEMGCSVTTGALPDDEPVTNNDSRRIVMSVTAAMSVTTSVTMLLLLVLQVTTLSQCHVFTRVAAESD